MDKQFLFQLFLRTETVLFREDPFQATFINFSLEEGMSVVVVAAVVVVNAVVVVVAVVIFRYLQKPTFSLNGKRSGLLRFKEVSTFHRELRRSRFRDLGCDCSELLLAFSELAK